MDPKAFAIGAGIGAVVATTAFVAAWKLSVRGKVIETAAQIVANGVNDPQISAEARPFLRPVFVALAGAFRGALEQQLP